MDLNNLIKSWPVIGEPKTPCKGVFYRCYVSCYNDHENRLTWKTELRKLKRESCPGCHDCDYISILLSDVGMDDAVQVKLDKLENGKKYRAVIQGYSDYNGYTGDYDSDWWYEFEEVK